jgi:hypothetical protein
MYHPNLASSIIIFQTFLFLLYVIFFKSFYVLYCIVTAITVVPINITTVYYYSGVEADDCQVLIGLHRAALQAAGHAPPACLLLYLCSNWVFSTNFSLPQMLVVFVSFFSEVCLIGCMSLIFYFTLLTKN